MKNLCMGVCLAVMMVNMVTIAMDNNVDIRKFGLEFEHNRQDAFKNTFWHRLGRQSEYFDDWSQVQNKIDLFKQNNKNWLPNPLIHNEDGKTAREETKAVFNKTGNPISGLLVIFFKQQEEQFLNKMALKVNRETMPFAQQLDCEVAKQLSNSQLLVLVAHQEQFPNK